MGEAVVSVDWRDGAVVLIDQRRLPGREERRVCESAGQVADAIREMVVRGAPAIGCAAAFGMALAAEAAAGRGERAVRAAAVEAAALLAATRPTAVNLGWALDRVLRLLELAPSTGSGEGLAALVLEEARRIRSEDLEANRAMGRLGAALLPDPCTVLTHCNTGALATAGHGTALGIVRSAVEAGKRVRVLADETRPLCQGSRLTAWELAREGIDVTVIADGAAGAMMRAGRVDLALVGADRIAANGDVANKVGTYTVAVLCRHHGLPFYVAAPTSTVDLSTPNGERIPIEQRAREELDRCGSTLLVAAAASVSNPAFDVTPAELVTAIVTERGVARVPYVESLPALLSDEG